MLNTFPTLLDFGLLAPFLIRIVAGLIFIDLGIFKLTRERKQWTGLFRTFLRAGAGLVNVLALVEIVGGLLLIIGMFTQVSALALGLLTFVNLNLEFKNPAFVRRDFTFYVMLFAMTMSLLFTGAGFFAYDLPL